MARILTLCITLAAGLTAAALATPALTAELVMVDEKGCIYCEQWNAEIGPIYPKTAEGRFAPLRKIDIGDIDEAIELDRRVNFTPTFIVVEDEAELARIEGYPGPDFFWPLLDRMLRDVTDYAGEDG